MKEKEERGKINEKWEVKGKKCKTGWVDVKINISPKGKNTIFGRDVAGWGPTKTKSPAVALTRFLKKISKI